jgi:asparagine synthase (glutamine-hydrolysing)
MIAALRHRGPDGDGACLFDACALGHTRLSVIDIAGGSQPMLSPDGAVAVVFNGEIYGYKDLRAELRGEYAFRTASDTELLLALFERDRHALLDRLPGMFAFAIWDDRRRELFCARDRFGEKPYFYAFAGDGAFVFASELKAILASGLVEPVVDPDSVAHYLRRLYVHPHRTIYRNVFALPPGHRLIYRDGHADVARYWAPPRIEPHIEIDDAVGRFRELLTRAVAKQWIADVPVGAFLSGGLDSSTIVALAAREGRKCKTFSFGFGQVIDERPFARGIAERYGTDHVELSDEESGIADLLVDMADVYDEPFGDSSNIPTYLLCRLARRHVTVALTGEGSDELLAGYSYWYRALFEMEQAGNRGLPVALMARVVAGLCRRAHTTVPGWAHSAVSGAMMRQRFGTVGEAHARQSACFSDDETASLLGRDAAPDGDAMAASTVDEVLRHDAATYLPGDILVKADRASMAHGLELRAPFLDRDFAEFCLSLPLRLKINQQTDKVILRRAFADAWTPAIRTRGKQGFGAPVAHWLRQPSVRALAEDTLRGRGGRVYDLVSFDAAAPHIDRDDYRTWALLVLGLWARSGSAAARATATPSPAALNATPAA